MTIDFICECCKQKVNAPEDAGGKYGKCPNCKHRCYIPTLRTEEDEELKLTPIDENEESRYNEMMRETHDLTQNILHETALDDEHENTTPNDIDEKNLIKGIIIYLLQMNKGDLDSAEKVIGKLNRSTTETRDILKRMAKTERPEPELREIPEKVLRGLMKDLYVKLE